MSPLSLYDLNLLVKSTVESGLRTPLWLAAELSEVRLASGGHCYVEFVEKEPAGHRLVAKARGNIWRNTYALLAPYFERETGRRLAPGMKVLVEVTVSFHELYGYALNVTDIDPTYTLGDVARKRKEILDRLSEEGVIDLNKELPLPRPLERIAVISSGTAAGYGDFRHQLEQSGFVFETRLFAATMQGDRVEESIISALDLIAEERECWDAVVIIRGGGAVSDLNGFDTYLLAANVAQFPLPVLTGIGHERDDTVLDVVAHTRLKTPTAVAAFLVDSRRMEMELVGKLEERFESALRRLMAENRNRFDYAAQRLQMAAVRYTGRERERLLRMNTLLETRVCGRLEMEDRRLELLRERMYRLVERQLSAETQKLAYLERSVRLSEPERILEMGFSLTLCNGKAVRDAACLKTGDRIETLLGRGRVRSIVEQEER